LGSQGNETLLKGYGWLDSDGEGGRVRTGVKMRHKRDLWELAQIIRLLAEGPGKTHGKWQMGKKFNGRGIVMKKW